MPVRLRPSALIIQNAWQRFGGRMQLFSYNACFAHLIYIPMSLGFNSQPQLQQVLHYMLLNVPMQAQQIAGYSVHYHSAMALKVP